MLELKRALLLCVLAAFMTVFTVSAQSFADNFNTETVTQTFTYKSKLTLDCDRLKNAANDVQFFRAPEVISPDSNLTTANVADIKEFKDRVKIENTKLEIEDIRGEDFKGYHFYCESKSLKKRVKFNRKMTPYLYKPDKQSQTITEDGSVEFSCSLLYGGEDNKPVTWSWIKKDSAPEALLNNPRITIIKTENSTKLSIANVVEADKGFYTCRVETDYGAHEETIQLRVKNVLAALWPFLAIVAEVLVLCIVILVYEKKCAKKPNNEDDNEQAQQFLSKDGQNVTKRNVKA